MRIRNWLNKFTRTELFAAVIGALIVIPQAISFSFLAGVPPAYGLYCALFMGLIASLIGRSPIISGPNTAVAILVGATLRPFAGVGTPLYGQYLALLTLMVAGCQLLFYLFRWHRMFDYIHPVTVKAISTSIGVLLIVSSLDGMMGITPYRTIYFYDKLISLDQTVKLINPFVFTVAIITIVSGLLARSRWPRYHLAIALASGLVTTIVIDTLFSPITSQMDRLGKITIELWPFFKPDLSTIEFAVYGALVVPALVIAYLGLSQTLVIAKDMETMPEIRDFEPPSGFLSRYLKPEISLRREVLAQGLGNLSSFFLGAFVGSGSFNRTMINLDVGSKTKLAGILSSVVVWLFIMLFSSFITMLPMAVIYGSLCIVGIGMIKPTVIRNILAHPGERWLFAVVIFALLVLGLTTGIAVAFVLSVIMVAVSSNSIEWTDDASSATYKVRGPLNYVTQQGFSRKVNQLFGQQPAKELEKARLDLSGLTIASSSQSTPLADELKPYVAKGLTVIWP